MGCNCKKSKQKEKALKRQQQILKGEVETVSLNILKTRRSACRSCKHSTKNPHPKFAKFGGLTSQSSCKLSNRQLIEALKDPLYECPEKHF